MKWLLCGLVALGLLAGGAGQGRAQPSYVYSTFDVPFGYFTRAYGINDSGQIVGTYEGGTGGFLFSGGSFTPLNQPGSAGTFPYGINNSGQIAGFAGASPHAFLLSGGSYTTLRVPGSILSYAQGINASGQIVGYYEAGSLGR